MVFPSFFEQVLQVFDVMSFLVLGIFEFFKARHEDDFLDLKRFVESMLEESSDFGLEAVSLGQFGNEERVICKGALSLIKVLLSFVNGIPDENESEHNDDKGGDSEHGLELVDVSIDSGHQDENPCAVPMVLVMALSIASVIWFF
jgi:hypothetical protein